MKIEKEVKNGKITEYFDVELPDLKCPFCGRVLNFWEDDEQAGQGTAFHTFNFACSHCSLKFIGLENQKDFASVEDFYGFVRDRLLLVKPVHKVFITTNKSNIISKIEADIEKKIVDPEHEYILDQGDLRVGDSFSYKKRK